MKKKPRPCLSRLRLLSLVLLCGCGSKDIELDELARAGHRVEGPKVFPVFADKTDFEPLADPRPEDWLLGPGRDERPQTSTDYVTGNPVRASTQWRRVVLQPLGQFNPGDQELLESFRGFASLFFVCPINLAKVLPLPASRRRERIQNQGSFEKKRVQHHTKTTMEEVLAHKIGDIFSIEHCLHYRSGLEPGMGCIGLVPGSRTFLPRTASGKGGNLVCATDETLGQLG